MITLQKSFTKKSTRGLISIETIPFHVKVFFIGLAVLQVSSVVIVYSLRHDDLSCVADSRFKSDPIFVRNYCGGHLFTIPGHNIANGIKHLNPSVHMVNDYS